MPRLQKNTKQYISEKKLYKKIAETFRLDYILREIGKKLKENITESSLKQKKKKNRKNLRQQFISLNLQKKVNRCFQKSKGIKREFK